MPIQEGGTFSPDNRIVSPGVFTRENDISGIAQGVADIGAVIVAPFPKGPGFSPTLLTNVADLENKFGVADGVYYGPYTAAEYLAERGMVTVCRVGGLTGYKQNYPFIVWGIKGAYNRGVELGAVDATANSIIYPSGSTDASAITNSISAVNISSGSSFTGSITFTSASFNVEFVSTVGNSTSSLWLGTYANFLANSAQWSGSTLYADTIQSLGMVNGPITVNVTGSWGGAGAGTSTSVWNAIKSGSFTGSFNVADLTFANASDRCW
jgi:hypothetical protein